MLLALMNRLFASAITTNILGVAITNVYACVNINVTRNLTQSTSRDGIDFDTICLIFGTVLGDSSMRRRMNARGSVMQLTQGADNYEYLLFVWNALHDKGLTTDMVPVIKTRSTGYGISHYAQFTTFTLPSLDWIYYSFYVTHSYMGYSNRTGTFKLKTTKRVPSNVSDYLSPLVPTCIGRLVYG